MNRGGAGGSSAPSRQEPGTISGFRPQGRNIDQTNVAAQQRAHTSGGSTAAFTGSVRDLNGMNEGHQPRDRQVRTRIAPPPAQTVAPAAPVATGVAATAPAAQGPARSGQDVYRDLIRQMADAEPAGPRERSPRRGDRRPLAVQRADQEAAMAPAGNKREIAMAKRDKTIPRPTLLTVQLQLSCN